MNNHYADPASNNWKKNKDSKRRNDEKLYSLIESFTPKNKRLHVLSFPANGWCFESGLSERITIPLSFTGLEKNDIVFGKAASTAKKLQKSFPNNWYTLYNTTSKNFLDTTSTRYDVVYLDWMGTWSTEKRDDLITIFKRRVLSKQALLMFTIWQVRGNGKEMDVLDTMVKKSSTTFPFEKHISAEMTPNLMRKTYGVAERVVRLARKEGYTATLAHFSEYKGNTKQCQLSFAFKLKTKSA